MTSQVSDQEFHRLPRSPFQQQLDRYMADTSAPRVEVTYSAQIGFKAPGSDKQQKASFSETRLVPKEAIKQAKHDQDFNHMLCHSIAYHYRDNGSMMDAASEQAGGKEKLMCYCCGKQKGTHVVQVPTESWHVEPLVITETAGYILCDNTACDAQAKQDFMKQADTLAAFWKFLQEKEGGIKRCMSCRKMDDDLKRCSRCKKAYFCDATCQKRGWKKHKKECVPASATAAAM